MRYGSGTKGERSHARLGMLGALLALSLLALGAMTIATAPGAHATSLADTVSLAILVPNPQSNIAEGPVGTNVTLSGQGAQAGHDYQLSYALVRLGCTAGGNLGNGTVKADASGKFTTTFVWPGSAAAVGSTYVICFKDTAQLGLPTPSDQSFRVDAASPPSITLAQVPATPIPGNVKPEGSYYAGDPVQIIGKNFYSNGTQLLAFVNLNQNFAPGDLQSANALKQPNDGALFPADANGSFTVTVNLPSAIIGNLFLHVVSNDGTGKYLPALIATQPIKIIARPNPTATVAPTVTPTAGVTPTPGGSGGSGNGADRARLLGVISLSGLSILLFILGVYLLTSTGASPRNL
jgi:hypothetical protein